MIEQVETVADEVEAFDAVAEGENVGEAGEDVADGQRLFEAGHVLRPSDLGLLKSVGLDAAPRLRALDHRRDPDRRGAGAVRSRPGRGDRDERADGLAAGRAVGRRGPLPRRGHRRRGRALGRDRGRPRRRRCRHHRGSSVGERDLLPEVIDSIGEVLVHGVALKPGHPVCLGVVDDTPIVSLPGYPVACIVNAAQFLRPLQKHVGGTTANPFPTRRATLTRKVPSEPGTRTFARVSVEGTGEGGDGDGDDSALPAATPTRASGSGILSSVALADGWVVVPEPREGLDAGEIVDVELWEASQ